MKVDFMRKVDFWIGVPLCLFLSIFVLLFRFFTAHKNLSSKNVLFIELPEMGSAVLVDPAMRKIRQKISANLFFVIFAKNKPSLQLLNTVADENIFCIRENSFFKMSLDMLRFLIWTRKNRIDTVIDLDLFQRITALLTILCGAKKRIGFHAFHNEGLYRGAFLTHKVSYNPHIHIAKNYIALVNAAMSEEQELPFSKEAISDGEIALEKMAIDDSQKTAMRDKIKALNPSYDDTKHKLLLINPNASELLIQRRWMPEYYTELIRMILKTFPDVMVLITGAPAEREEAQALKDSVSSDRCINSAGELVFLELPVLYAVSHCMVTNDSGPGHFSAVTELPTFVIFGPETPKLYGSLGNSRPIYSNLACSPCVSASNHRKTPCIDNQCLKVIKPAEVFEIIQPSLVSDVIIRL
ncbi:MAG: glycosyltransferase family 9 protein [Deltaproteobacteria bacterium]|nr:glycosyltransferase family 9 protein [Deltaproteobacteria bacterium]